MEKFYFRTIEDTQRFGESFAKDLKPNTVIALTGDLGAGKTFLTAAIAKGLGIEGRITSPTFTIVQEYDDGRLPLYHFDVYRVNDEDELFEIGFDDYLHAGGVSIIEWADLIEDMLPPGTINIKLSYGENDNERVCEIC